MKILDGTFGHVAFVHDENTCAFVQAADGQFLPIVHNDAVPVTFLRMRRRNDVANCFPGLLQQRQFLFEHGWTAASGKGAAGTFAGAQIAGKMRRYDLSVNAQKKWHDFYSSFFNLSKRTAQRNIDFHPISPLQRVIFQIYYCVSGVITRESQ